MTIKCEYDKLMYELGCIVLYKEQPYVIIASEYDFDALCYRYELTLYDEYKLEFIHEYKLVEAD